MKESLIIAAAIIGAAVLVSIRLQEVSRQISRQTNAIRDQTYQMDWLVTHYAKPVRPIFGEEKK